jgi:uncharacterized protein
MKQIKDILEGIAANKNVEILFACETGSRAWGFPSPDSDYDIRFIYRHRLEWYLSLSEQKDTIEIMDGDFDITGWDIRKCLRLLKRSNVALIERLQSPIEYSAGKGFKTDFNQLIKTYYSPVAAFFHHYSMAKNYWDEIKDEAEVKLKSYFYLVRSLLSCNWITTVDDVLPMETEGLMKKFENEKVKRRLRELIALKGNVNESYRHILNEEDVKWITGLFETLEIKKENLKVNRTDSRQLNDSFLKMVYGTTDNR